MRPKASASGGETTPLAHSMNPTKKRVLVFRIRLRTLQFSRAGRRGPQRLPAPLPPDYTIIEYSSEPGG
jgi:hypothetical protein